MPIRKLSNQVISLKKYLTDNEAEASILQIVKLLLEGIAVHSVEGDPEDMARFRESIGRVNEKINTEVSNSELLVLSGSALQSLEDYNRRTGRYLRLNSSEFQSMVKMLTSTVSAITEAGETGVRQLREIEKQVAAVTQIDDVRLIRSRLSECLNGIQVETERQRTVAIHTAKELTRGLESTTAGASTLDTDRVTGLPSRKSAEEALARACQAETPAHVLAFVVNRIQILNTRFGFEVGDEILRYFAGFMKSRLQPTDVLFRWSGPIMIAILFRQESLTRVRNEISQNMEARYQHTIQTATRTVLLPISTRWTVFPMMASARLLIQKIDGFGSFENPRD